MIVMLSNVNIYIHICICALCVRVCVQRAENTRGRDLVSGKTERGRIRPRAKVREGQRLEREGRRRDHGSHETAITTAMAETMATR